MIAVKSMSQSTHGRIAEVKLVRDSHCEIRISGQILQQKHSISKQGKENGEYSIERFELFAPRDIVGEK